jgi:prephenate dehydratase
MELRNIKVAIQGSRASFHDLAAKKHFGDTAEIISCKSFRESCEALAHNRADYVLIAAGNSLAGNILSNYELVREFGLNVISELYLKIELHLIGLPETHLEEIRFIRSHPMALRQCTEFLAGLSAQVIQDSDTASCAEAIALSRQRNTAAIAGYEAAHQYGLRILSENIHSREENYTRFWVLSKGETLVEDANKATLSFILDDKVGSLAEALFVFRTEGLGLSSIQSSPLPDSSGHYHFYADVEFSHKQKYLRCLRALSLKSKDLQVMGEYEKDQVPHYKSLSTKNHSLQSKTEITT